VANEKQKRSNVQDLNDQRGVTVEAEAGREKRSQVASQKWLDRVPWWGQCSALWLATLIVLSIVGTVVVRLVAHVDELGEGYLPWLGLSPYGIPGLWARWDSGYYLTLAQQGYAEFPEAMGFFPLYPILVAGLSRITGLSAAVSGMLISQLAYLAAILIFYKLARQIRDDHEYAMSSVLYMVLFPSSFFFFAVYAESLSLAFSVLAVYLALRTRPRYVQAGLAAGIASAARPVGWLLNIVPVTEFIRRRDFTLSSLLALAAGLALSVSGIALFVWYLYSITGTFTAVFQAQAPWQRTWQYPWVTIWKSIRIAATGVNVSGNWFLYVINWSHLFFTTLALVLTGVAFWRSYRKRFRWSVAIYMLVSLAFLLTSQGVEAEPMSGMTRWVGALFPMYLVLGDLTQSRIARGLLAVISGMLLVVMTAWWMSGRWVG
jgi:hypothetical protein